MRTSFLIVIAFILSGSLRASSLDSLIESDIEVPISLGSNNVYVEKFSPIYIQDLTEEQLEKLGFGEESSDFGAFLSILENYNKVFYRKFNSALESNIASLENADKFKTTYLRDFDENQDKSIRYIVSNNYSIVDLYLASKDRDIDLESKLGYYVFDKETNTKHKINYNLTTLLTRIDTYYNMEQRGMMSDLSQESLTKLLNKIEYDPPKEKKFSKVSWGVFIFAGVAILTNLLLNN